MMLPWTETCCLLPSWTVSTAASGAAEEEAGGALLWVRRLYGSTDSRAAAGEAGESGAGGFGEFAEASVWEGEGEG